MFIRRVSSLTSGERLSWSRLTIRLLSGWKPPTMPENVVEQPSSVELEKPLTASPSFELSSDHAHQRLIQALRSSLRSAGPTSLSSRGGFQSKGSTGGFGSFYGDGNRGDDSGEYDTLDMLRKIQAQYRKWGQTEQALEIGKEISSIESASRVRQPWRYRVKQNIASQDQRTPELGPDIRAETSGVNELIQKGLSEEDALKQVAEDIEAKSVWTLGSIDPAKRSRWQRVREQVLAGEINFDDNSANFAPQSKDSHLMGPKGQDEHQADKIKPQREQAKPMLRSRTVDQFGRSYGTGRRKTSIARVWLKPCKNETEGIRMSVNGRPYIEYFTRIEHRNTLFDPMLVTGTYGKFNVRATVKGGGISGQAGAIRLGVARALQNDNPEHRAILKQNKFLTRDSRMVERKKPGRRKARASFPFVKR